MVVMPIVEKIEDRESLAIDDDRRAVDDARLHRRGGHRGSDLRETRSKIIAIAGEPSHAIALAPGQDPKAVVLDFVNPATAARRRVCPPREGRAGIGWRPVDPSVKRREPMPPPRQFQIP